MSSVLQFFLNQMSACEMKINHNDYFTRDMMISEFKMLGLVENRLPHIGDTYSHAQIESLGVHGWAYCRTLLSMCGFILQSSDGCYVVVSI